MPVILPEDLANEQVNPNTGLILPEEKNTGSMYIGDYKSPIDISKYGRFFDYGVHISVSCGRCRPHNSSYTVFPPASLANDHANKADTATSAVSTMIVTRRR